MEVLLWEIRQISSNAVKFNEATSGIVTDAKFIVKLLCKFIKDPTLKDIVSLYTEMDDMVETKVHVLFIYLSIIYYYLVIYTIELDNNNMLFKRCCYEY